MNRQPIGPRTKDIEKELAKIGGEPLKRSGFEEETPNPDYSGSGPTITLPIPAHWTPTHIANFRKVWEDVLASDGKKPIIFLNGLN